MANEATAKVIAAASAPGSEWTEWSTMMENLFATMAKPMSTAGSPFKEVMPWPAMKSPFAATGATPWARCRNT